MSAKTKVRKKHLFVSVGFLLGLTLLISLLIGGAPAPPKTVVAPAPPKTVVAPTLPKTVVVVSFEYELKQPYFQQYKKLLADHSFKVHHIVIKSEYDYWDEAIDELSSSASSVRFITWHQSLSDASFKPFDDFYTHQCIQVIEQMRSEGVIDRIDYIRWPAHDKFMQSRGEYPTYKEAVLHDALHTTHGITTSVANSFLDKVVFKQRLQKKGIPVIPFVDVPEKIDQLGDENTKVVLKLRIGVGSCKMQIGTLKEIKALWSKDKTHQHEFFAEKYIEGVHCSSSGIVQCGKIVAHLPQKNRGNCYDLYVRKKVMGYHILAEDLPEAKKLTQTTQKILRSINYRDGAYEMEYIQDKDGNFWVLEVQPRTGNTINRLFDYYNNYGVKDFTSLLEKAQLHVLKKKDVEFNLPKDKHLMLCYVPIEVEHTKERHDSRAKVTKVEIGGRLLRMPEIKTRNIDYNMKSTNLAGLEDELLAKGVMENRYGPRHCFCFLIEAETEDRLFEVYEEIEQHLHIKGSEVE